MSPLDADVRNAVVSGLFQESLVVVLSDRDGGPASASPFHRRVGHDDGKIVLRLRWREHEELAKYFKIQRSESNGVWNLQLQPKGGMARVFTRVEVKGDRYIQKLLMEEKSGDKTELNFSAVIC